MAFNGLYVAICCLIMICLAQASKIEDVLDLNFEPRIAIQCGKLPKHIDVKTGQWIDGANKQEFCSSDPKEILKLCQATYPDIDVTNIVEANDNVTICANAECKSSYSVVPYRCLVGQFEADAINQPFFGECTFGYVHETKTCKSHAYWKERALQICEGKGKYLEKFGILAPCGTDLFSGVEYNCCKNPTTKLSTQAPTTKPKSDAEILEDLLNKFAARIPAKSKGCDRSIYTAKLDLLHKEKDAKVGKLAKDLNEAKARMEELKKDDPDQAKSFFKKTLQIFQGSLKNINQQTKVDESQLNQEKKECAQMMLNHKKHLAMKAFVNAVRQHSEPAKIIKSFQRFTRILENDQNQNMRTLSKKVMAKHPDKLMPARDVFLKHLHVVKSALKEGVDILKKVETVHGKIKFDLPPFATDIDFEFAHNPKTTPPPPPTTEEPTVDEGDEPVGLDEDELSNENEHYYPTEEEPKPRISDGLKVKHEHPLKSRAVFAAVIGLSCGALVIMIVIVLALFIRKRSPKRGTKTVIADDDSQEKRHLLKMQEDGFENPTYKFFSN